MWIHLDEEDPKPLYLQLKEQVIREILNGSLRPRDELPSIRKLAKDARTSVITVKRAYQELEYEKYIYTMRGKGSFVKEQDDDALKERHRDQFTKKMKELIQFGESVKFSDEEMKEMIDRCFKERGMK